MNKPTSSFSVSHNYQVKTPTETRAYLVSIPEWDFLKERISKVGGVGSFYHTIGSILLGASLSAVVAAIATDLCPTPGVQCTKDIVVWAFAATTGFSGLLSLHFGKAQENIKTVYLTEVLGEMEAIESKYNEMS